MCACDGAVRVRARARVYACARNVKPHKSVVCLLVLCVCLVGNELAVVAFVYLFCVFVWLAVS